MRIYVASSWRSGLQPRVVRCLREAGHEVYDFREMAAGERRLDWSDIDPDWRGWTPDRLREGLRHGAARDCFGRVTDAMRRAAAFVLVQPCGRSAHLELGWAIGAGKHTSVLLAAGEDPELMYGMADTIAVDTGELVDQLRIAGLGRTRGEAPSIDRLLGMLESRDLSGMGHEARRLHHKRIGDLRAAGVRVALAELVKPDAIDGWMDAPNAMLDGRRPEDVARTEPDAVRDMIRRLASGEPG